MKFDTNALPLALETDFDDFKDRMVFLGCPSDERVLAEAYRHFQQKARLEGHLSNGQLRSLVREVAGIELDPV